MIIAVDGMGGDHAPKEIVKGCIQAINELDVEIALIGKKDLLEKELSKQKFNRSRLHIMNATEIILNEDKPVQAIRKKKDSSMVVGLNLLKEKKVDAFISAGNTGALLAGSLFILGRIKGIDRPAISAVFPTSKGMSLLVDAGANAECKPRNLLEFGLMGSVYSEKVLEKKNPSVGLVNIGAEQGKGTPLIKESFELFSKTDLNFYGNAEAREIPRGIVDVIVCDGFVGNVILKLTEGVAMTIMSMLKKQFTKNIINKLGAMLLMPSLKEFKKNLDYTEYGGAPLLGVKGAVIKAHGSSNAKAIKNAIKQAKVFAEKEVVQVINNEISRIGDEENA
ncbi:phosphate acyltransferase PlsX [Crassaminicella thermophila]|uniref:Phosphate acyltransferase n=1 Tax=Crassaminicella thermophila TaxID=2599308 RepID=A0A5C0SFI2_CRATE|nr:phosphate acyltransferase PlsX [Crassaminicella thermophila]QEK12018.1 phosphate acyltransferase PlsX [Crassaminicella thermophila]